LGSGKKAFCAVHLSCIYANCAQLYPQELWISFQAHSARSAPAEIHSRSARHACQRTRAAMRHQRVAVDAIVRVQAAVQALLKSPAEAKVTAVKNFQES
jgi:hypothetical protein